MRPVLPLVAYLSACVASSQDSAPDGQPVPDGPAFDAVVADGARCLPQPDAGPCGDPALAAKFQSCMQAKDKAACEAAGGSWGTLGLSTEPVCQCPTDQEGCSCSDSTACLSVCIRPWDGGACSGLCAGACSPWGRVTGCNCWFQNPGQVTQVCWDFPYPGP